MLNETDLQTATRSSEFAEPGLFQASFNDNLPTVPVRPDTLLVLELNLQQRSVDLRRISELVLADMGATLQVMQLAGREYGTPDERPVRVEDCISELGVEACFAAIAAQPIARDRRQIAIAEIWSHSREIAKYSRLVAEEIAGVNPEEAHLAGLFHAIGSLPRVLGWTEPTQDPVALANGWSLPQCVVDSLSDPLAHRRAGRWPEIVRRAHQIANRASHREQGIHSHLSGSV